MDIAYRIPLWDKYEMAREKKVEEKHRQIVVDWTSKIHIAKLLRRMGVIGKHEYELLWAQISANMVQTSKGSEDIVASLILKELSNGNNW